MFSHKFKTSVLSNNRFAKETSDLRGSCNFPPRQTPTATSVAQKHRAISNQEKMAFSTPPRVVLGLPPPPESVRAGGPTLTSQPKFLGSIGYQVCLAMELHRQALPVGSAIKVSL